MSWINWIIIGLVSFIIQIYVLKHTYTITILSKGNNKWDFDWEKAEKIGTPLWIALIMLITSIIPFVNMVETIIFWIIWLKYYSDPDVLYDNTWYTYWRFKDGFFSRKI